MFNVEIGEVECCSFCLNFLWVTNQTLCALNTSFGWNAPTLPTLNFSKDYFLWFSLKVLLRAMFTRTEFLDFLWRISFLPPLQSTNPSVYLQAMEHIAVYLQSTQCFVMKNFTVKPLTFLSVIFSRIVRMPAKFMNQLDCHSLKYLWMRL